MYMLCPLYLSYAILSKKIDFKFTEFRNSCTILKTKNIIKVSFVWDQSLFFGRKPLKLMSSDLRKKLTLSEIYTDLMIVSCWDFNLYGNAFASEIPGSILFNFLIYSWDCCDSLIPIQYINFFACLYLWFELCQKQLCIGMST